MIRAIETAYAGCRFRSRLEARWAVYFDARGERWEYEPESFELPDGTRYLPDFKLPAYLRSGGDLWVEVKPTADAFEKAAAFSAAAGVMVLGCYGMPALNTAYPMWLRGKPHRASVLDRWHAAAVDAARGARFEFGESGAR